MRFLFTWSLLAILLTLVLSGALFGKGNIENSVSADEKTDRGIDIEEDVSISTDQESQEVEAVPTARSARIPTGVSRTTSTSVIELNLSGSVTHFDGISLPLLSN
jgi:hypothetical protein